MDARGCIPSGTWGRIHFLPFPASRGHMHSLACGPSSVSKASSVASLQKVFRGHISLCLSSSVSLCHLRPTQIIWANLPMSGSFDHISKSLFPVSSHIHRVRAWTNMGAIILSTTPTRLLHLFFLLGPRLMSSHIHSQRPPFRSLRIGRESPRSR